MNIKINKLNYMNSYYIHDGTDSTGPFDHAQLKAKSITKSTPVWCAGMEDWKYAGEVAELQNLFIITPPPLRGFPIVQNQTPEPLFDADEEQPDPKIMGLDKTLFYIVVSILVLVIATTVISLFQDQRSAQLEQQNLQTEKENQLRQIEEKRIQDENAQKIEQEKLEFERVLKERKVSLNSQLVEVQQKLFVAVSSLDQAKDRLAKAQDFQFLRSENERENDINTSMKEIDIANKQIVDLKKEMDHIYLELEKIKV